MKPMHAKNADRLRKWAHSINSFAIMAFVMESYVYFLHTVELYFHYKDPLYQVHHFLSLTLHVIPHGCALLNFLITNWILRPQHAVVVVLIYSIKHIVTYINLSYFTTLMGQDSIYLWLGAVVMKYLTLAGVCLLSEKIKKRHVYDATSEGHD